MDTDRQPLALALVDANHWMSTSVLNLMHARGHTELTTSHLLFFYSLDCGLTHASAVARRMGSTRQAVYKTTKELQRLSILELLPAPDNKRQKVISMTPRGERVALDARECVASIEKHLAKQLGETVMRQMLDALGADWGSPL